jgi:adenylate cyclase
MPTMQLDRLPEGVIAEPYGEVELRGFPGPVDVVSLTGAPHTASLDASELWTRSPFI